MKKTSKNLIQFKSLIVGIDIAKNKHWAQMMYQGDIIGKAFPIENTTTGFKNLVSIIEKKKKEFGATNIVVGMEPTGHYFKPLAYYLQESGMCHLVLVNPFHVNRSKEFEDNSPSKTDPKDARLIAKLVYQGNYFSNPLSFGMWAELRAANVNRLRLTQKRWRLKCQLITVLDQYFPEFNTVFKNILGKGAIHILKHYSFPDDILEAGGKPCARGLEKPPITG